MPEQQIQHTSRRSSIRRRLWLRLLALLLVAVGGFAAWTWVTLNFAYSTGQRTGYLQKFSRKGWLCKTWEGELAMTAQPGVAPQIFHFSVRDPAAAQEVLALAGQRVALSYDQHRGVPTSCFGETEYFVTNARPVGP